VVKKQWDDIQQLKEKGSLWGFGRVRRKEHESRKVKENKRGDFFQLK
jgi:hypothetical protein